MEKETVHLKLDVPNIVKEMSRQTFGIIPSRKVILSKKAKARSRKVKHRSQLPEKSA